jgi:hypothetical protein
MADNFLNGQKIIENRAVQGATIYSFAMALVFT